MKAVRAARTAATALERRSSSISRARSPVSLASCTIANNASSVFAACASSSNRSHSDAFSGSTVWCTLPYSGTRAPIRPGVYPHPWTS